MKNIPLHIINNQNGKAFDCYLIESRQGWQCVLNREFYCYKIIQESPLSQCMDVLAQYFAPFKDVTVLSENDSDANYVTVLNSKIRQVQNSSSRKNRNLN